MPGAGLASLIISIHHDAGLYSRDIIAMVAGGEGDGGGGSSHTVSVCS